MSPRARSLPAAAFGVALGFAAGAAATVAVQTGPAFPARSGAAVCPYAGSAGEGAWEVDGVPRCPALAEEEREPGPGQDEGVERCPYLSGRAAARPGPEVKEPAPTCPFAPGVPLIPLGSGTRV